MTLPLCAGLKEKMRLEILYTAAYLAVLVILTPGSMVAAGERFRWQVKPGFEKAESFSSGLAAVRVSGRYGYIDMNGDIRIEPQYDEAGDFMDDFAPVVKEGVPGFVNKKGMPQIILKHDDSIYFGEGIAVIKSGGKFGYLTRSGKLLCEPAYEDAVSFSEGLAAVKINGKYGYINKKGKTVIKPLYEKASLFSGGLAAVKLGSSYGYINKRGRLVIKPVYEAAGNFSGGIAAVKSGGLYGYIGSGGSFVVSPRFEDAAELSEGIAAVQEKGRWGYIKFTAKEQNSNRKKGDERGAGMVFKKEGVPESVPVVRSNEVKKYNPDDKRGVRPSEMKDSFMVNQPRREFSKEQAGGSEERGAGETTVKTNAKGSGYIGVVSEVRDGQVVIIEDGTDDKIYMGAWCIASTKGDAVYIEAETPISTIAKCDVPSVILEKIKPGMKVYKRFK